MQKTFESALDSEGRPIANASVTVLNYPSGTIATIYSDNGVSQKINPFLTNANGLYEFYADNGRYSIRISGTNLVTVQIDDVSISDIAAANSVTNAKLAPAPAHTFKGNNTNTAANVQDLTATQLTAELIAFAGDTGAGGTKGLVPAPIAGDAAKYLRADGSWQVVVGGGTGNAAHEYVIATGGSLNYLLTPVQAITAYALNQSQIYEVQWNADCVDNPTAAISGLAAKNIVVLSGDGTYANAAARDIVTGSISTLETIDGGGGILKLWLKDPAVLHSNLSSVSTNTAFTVATAYGRVIKSTGTAARQHTLPVFSTWPLEGVFELIAENTSMQIARQAAGDVVDYYGVNLATDGVTGAFIDVPAGTQITFIKTATSWQITSTLNRQSLNKLPSLTVTQAANAATITLSPFTADFRNATLTSGTPSSRTLAANASFVIPSGATLGVPTVGSVASVTATGTTTLTLNAAPSAPIQIGDVLAGANIPTNVFVKSFGTYLGGTGLGTLILSNAVTTAATGMTFTKPSHLIVLALDNAGVIEVALVNQAGNLNLDETGIIDTTAASSSSNSSSIVYSTAARTAMPYKIVGMIDLANPTAGQYSVPPLQVTSISLSTLAMTPKRSWRRVLSVEKVNGLTYWNTTKHEIIIEVSIANTYPSNATINFTVDGFAFTQIAQESPNSGFGTRIGTYQKIIPPGKSYISNASGLTDWMEYSVP